MENIIKEIKSALAGTQYADNSNIIERLSIYANELAVWNVKFNLTAVADAKGIAIKHMADSLIPSDHGVFEGIHSLADCGTGAGFPGIPLAIVNPETAFTLIESNNKKITFLEHIKDILKLKNIECLSKRSENLSHTKQYRHFFESVSMRAFANFSAAMELTSELVKPGGKIYFYASDEQANLINGKEKVFSELKLTDMKKYFYTLPEDFGKRAVVYFHKSGNASENYPRSYSKIKNHPI